MFLSTLYVLFFIEVGTRRIHIAKATRNPDAAFVTQQARNLYMAGELPTSVRFLIRDRDSKYTWSFDAVFETEGARVVVTPIRAPKTNAFAERWVRTVRAEILDWTLVLGRRHLDRLLTGYASHTTTRIGRIGGGGPAEVPTPSLRRNEPDPGPIERREVLPGINEYLAA